MQRYMHANLEINDMKVLQANKEYFIILNYWLIFYIVIKLPTYAMAFASWFITPAIPSAADCDCSYNCKWYL